MTTDNLPAGLVFHCDACGIVIPADAPRPAGGDCAWVAEHRMAWFDPDETLKGQHTMATAAWHLIYDRELKEAAHPQAVEYLRTFRSDPQQHFRCSHARRALSTEHVAQQRAMKPNRDAAFYKD